MTFGQLIPGLARSRHNKRAGSVKRRNELDDCHARAGGMQVDNAGRAVDRVAGRFRWVVDGESRYVGGVGRRWIFGGERKGGSR